MKIAQPTSAPAAGLVAGPPGLTKKHTRQLRKAVARSVKKLARTFAHLLAKEQRARARQQRQAAKEAVRNLVRQLPALLAQPHPAPAGARAA